MRILVPRETPPLAPSHHRAPVTPSWVPVVRPASGRPPTIQTRLPSHAALLFPHRSAGCWAVGASIETSARPGLHRTTVRADPRGCAAVGGQHHLDQDLDPAVGRLLRQCGIALIISSGSPEGSGSSPSHPGHTTAGDPIDFREDRTLESGTRTPQASMNPAYLGSEAQCQPTTSSPP